MKGVITMEELGTVLQSLHEHPTMEEIQEMVNQVDDDGDGTLNFEEFLNIMAIKLKVPIMMSSELNRLMSVHTIIDCVELIHIRIWPGPCSAYLIY